MHRILLLVLASLFIGLVPLHAQDTLTEAERADLAIVNESFANFDAQESYQTSAQSSIAQVVEVSVGDLTQTVEQNIDQLMTGVAVRNDTGGYNSEFTVEQDVVSDMGTGVVEFPMTIDMISLDDIFYINITSDAPELAGMLTNGWINLAESGSSVPALQLIQPEQFAQLVQNPVTVELTDEVTTSVTLLGEDELDGQAVAIYEVGIDAKALFSGDAMGQAMNAFDFSQFEALGMDIEGLIEEMGNSSAISYVVYVGIDDAMLYRVETVMDIALETSMEFNGELVPFTLEQTVSSVTEFFDFGIEVEIEAPI